MKRIAIFALSAREKVEFVEANGNNVSIDILIRHKCYEKDLFRGFYQGRQG